MSDIHQNLTPEEEEKIGKWKRKVIFGGFAAKYNTECRDRLASQTILKVGLCNVYKTKKKQNNVSCFLSFTQAAFTRMAFYAYTYNSNKKVKK